MKVLSTNIGKRTKIQYKSKVYNTGINKYPVDEGVYLGQEDVARDVVLDRKHHGGVNQAVYAFGFNHYPYFREKFPDQNWHQGMFGENLTIDLLDETKLYIGEQYQLGEALLEISQVPRKPCSTLGAKFQDMSIVKVFWNTDKPGVYFKVIKEGHVKPGDTFIRTKSVASDALSVAEVFISNR